MKWLVVFAAVGIEFAFGLLCWHLTFLIGSVLPAPAWRPIFEVGVGLFLTGPLFLYGAFLVGAAALAMFDRLSHWGRPTPRARAVLHSRDEKP